MLYSDGYARALKDNSAQTAFSLTAGRTLTKPQGLILMGEGPNGPRPRGLDMILFGTGSDNTTFDMKLWGVNVTLNADNGQIEDYELKLLLTISCTLCATFGVGSTCIKTTDRLVDTLSALTPTSYLSALVAAFNGVSASFDSPANDSGATLFVPDVGDIYGFVPEFDMTGALTANVAYRRVI